MRFIFHSLPLCCIYLNFLLLFLLLLYLLLLLLLLPLLLLSLLLLLFVLLPSVSPIHHPLSTQPRPFQFSLDFSHSSPHSIIPFTLSQLVSALLFVVFVFSFSTASSRFVLESSEPPSFLPTYCFFYFILIPFLLMILVFVFLLFITLYFSPFLPDLFSSRFLFSSVFFVFSRFFLLLLHLLVLLFIFKPQRDTSDRRNVNKIQVDAGTFWPAGTPPPAAPPRPPSPPGTRFTLWSQWVSDVGVGWTAMFVLRFFLCCFPGCLSPCLPIFLLLIRLSYPLLSCFPLSLDLLPAPFLFSVIVCPLVCTRVLVGCS